MEKTAKEVRESLKAACEASGSQIEWAKRHKLSGAFVSDVIRGRRDPSDAICKALGLKRVIVYRTAT